MENLKNAINENYDTIMKLKDLISCANTLENTATAAKYLNDAMTVLVNRCADAIDINALEKEIDDVKCKDFAYTVLHTSIKADCFKNNNFKPVDTKYCKMADILKMADEYDCIFVYTDIRGAKYPENYLNRLNDEYFNNDQLKKCFIFNVGVSFINRENKIAKSDLYPDIVKGIFDNTFIGRNNGYGYTVISKTDMDIDTIRKFD